MSSLVVLGNDEGKLILIRFHRVGKKKGRGKFYLVVCWEINIFPKGSWNTCFWVSDYVSKLKVKVKSLSCVRLFTTPLSIAHQAPLSMGFFRQEYWSGLPFPSPGDLPGPGIEPGSPALQTEALLSELPGKPVSKLNKSKNSYKRINQ